MVHNDSRSGSRVTGEVASAAAWEGCLHGTGHQARRRGPAQMQYRVLSEVNLCTVHLARAKHVLSMCIKGAKQVTSASIVSWHAGVWLRLTFHCLEGTNGLWSEPQEGASLPCALHLRLFRKQCLQLGLGATGSKGPCPPLVHLRERRRCSQQQAHQKTAVLSAVAGCGLPTVPKPCPACPTACCSWEAAGQSKLPLDAPAPHVLSTCEWSLTSLSQTAL